jgi:spore coat protein U-like protein
MNVRAMVVAVAVAGAAVCGAIALGAQGGTNSKTANLKVTAEVVSDCQLIANDLNFGQYDPVGANKSTPLDSRTTLNLTCTKGTSAKLEIDACAHASGQQRILQGPRNFPLKYDLMQRSSGGSRWGTGSDAFTMTVHSSSLYSITVFGRIPAGQDAPAGQYADTCVVTVSY